MYNINQNAFNQQVAQLAAVFLGFLIVTLVLSVIFYLLNSFGLMRIAKRSNIKHSWLAFVPIANSYVLGKVAFSDKLKPILFLFLNILSVLFSINIYYAIALSFINGSSSYPSSNVILNLFQLIYLIFFFYVMYKIYKKYSTKSTIILLFFVLTCGFLNPIFLFAIRNNDVISD